MGITIEENVQKLIDERGWTLYRLSKESGVPMTTLYALKKKINGPTADTIVKLADALNTTTDLLIRGEEYGS
ncbi:helix-turn-helix protein [compost metagenome]